MNGVLTFYFSVSVFNCSIFVCVCKDEILSLLTISAEQNDFHRTMLYLCLNSYASEH